MRALLLVLLVPAAAAASPKICLPPQDGPTTLSPSGDGVIVCATAGCVLATPKQVTAAKAPAPSPKAVEIKDGKACAGATCKPLGKKLAKAVAAGKSADATSDLALVVVKTEQASTLWNLAKDKQLAPKKPAEYKKSGEKDVTLLSLDVIGSVVEASWSACAGPCAQGVLVDATGATRPGGWFPAGEGVMLDATRLAIVPDEASGSLTVLDVKGKQLGTLPLGDGTSAVVRAGITKLSGDDLAIFWDDGTTANVQRVSAPAGKPPSVVWTQKLAACE